MNIILYREIVCKILSDQLLKDFQAQIWSTDENILQKVEKFCIRRNKNKFVRAKKKEAIFLTNYTFKLHLRQFRKFSCNQTYFALQTLILDTIC